MFCLLWPISQERVQIVTPAFVGSASVTMTVFRYLLYDHSGPSVLTHSGNVTRSVPFEPLTLIANIGDACLGAHCGVAHSIGDFDV